MLCTVDTVLYYTVAELVAKRPPPPPPPPTPHTHLLPYAYIMPKINKTYCAEIHVLWETWMVCRNAIADFNLM